MLICRPTWNADNDTDDDTPSPRRRYGQEGRSNGEWGQRRPSGQSGSYRSQRPEAPQRPAPRIVPVTPDPSTMRSIGSRKVSNSEYNSSHDLSVQSKYSIGMTVEHAKFGRGQIINIEEMPSDIKITVIFADPTCGKKSLLSKYANLKIID